MRTIATLLISLFAGLPPASGASSSATTQPVRSPYVTGEFAPSALEGMPFRIYGTQRMLDSGESYPLLLVLHGIGERGRDNGSQLRHAAKDFSAPEAFAKHPCFIVIPQCPEDHRWDDGQLAKVRGILRELCARLPVDDNRVYITGYSMGAEGVWRMIEDTPHFFAAAAALSGRGDIARAANVRDLPLRIFHTTLDCAYPVSDSRKMIAAVKASGNKDCALIECDGDDHDCWTRTYPAPAFGDWLFAQKRTGESKERFLRAGN